MGGPRRARGIGARFRRPVVVVQCDVDCDALNRSRIGTVVRVPLTSNLKWANAPGSVLLSRQATGLEKDSVANVSLLTAVDKRQLVECVDRVSPRQLQRLMSGIDVILGR